MKNDAREFEVNGKKISGAADCFIIAYADGLEELDAPSLDETLEFLARCGADAARAHWRGEERTQETIESMRRHGLSVVAAACSARTAYALKQSSVSILETPTTALNDAMLLAEICKAKAPLIVSAAARELEDMGHTISLLGKERGNFAIMWAPGDEPDRQMNLRTITAMRDLFPTTVIGFSAPAGGELHGVGALALGAWILEIKLGRDWKGNETSAETFQQAISDLRRVGQAL